MKAADDYFSDNEDVLAWLNNTKDTFKRYITSRRNRICTLSSPKQWRYIPTKYNPADLGTRPISVAELQASEWTTGPAFLYLQQPDPSGSLKQDQKSVMFFQAPSHSFFFTNTRHATEDLTTGSMWKRLLDDAKENQEFSSDKAASLFVERKIQLDAWPKGMASIKKLPLKKKRQILAITPFLDSNENLIKVGGRLTR